VTETIGRGQLAGVCGAPAEKFIRSGPVAPDEVFGEDSVFAFQLNLFDSKAGSSATSDD
jgi:hypothetical protein